MNFKKFFGFSKKDNTSMSKKTAPGFYEKLVQIKNVEGLYSLVNVLPNPDPVLRKTGKGFDTLRQLENEGQITQYIRIKKELDKEALKEADVSVLTKIQAELKHEDNLKTKGELKLLAEELNKGRIIDWENVLQDKYLLSFDNNTEKLRQHPFVITECQSAIYCLDKNFLKVAKERIGEVIKFIHCKVIYIKPSTSSATQGRITMSNKILQFELFKNAKSGMMSMLNF